MLSEPYPLHFLLNQVLPWSGHRLRGLRALMRRHFLRMLERATVGEIGSDAGRAKAVIADWRFNAGGGLSRLVNVQGLFPKLVSSRPEPLHCSHE
jgi:hypothetical protein